MLDNLTTQAKEVVQKRKAQKEQNRKDLGGFVAERVEQLKVENTHLKQDQLGMEKQVNLIQA